MEMLTHLNTPTEITILTSSTKELQVFYSPKRSDPATKIGWIATTAFSVIWDCLRK
jgi:hypothetical protein